MTVRQCWLYGQVHKDASMGVSGVSKGQVCFDVAGAGTAGCKIHSKQASSIYNQPDHQEPMKLIT